MGRGYGIWSGRGYFKTTSDSVSHQDRYRVARAAKNCFLSLKLLRQLYFRFLHSLKCGLSAMTTITSSLHWKVDGNWNRKKISTRFSKFSVETYFFHTFWAKNRWGLTLSMHFPNKLGFTNMEVSVICTEKIRKFNNFSWKTKWMILSWLVYCNY